MLILSIAIGIMVLGLSGIGLLLSEAMNHDYRVDQDSL